jgi:hypothetical protein
MSLSSLAAATSLAVSAVTPISPPLLRPRGQGAVDGGRHRGLGVDPDGGFAWIGQPDRAHLFFPGNDAVDDKAYFRYHVTVPKGWTVAANGQLVARNDTKGTSTFTYASAHPFAPQLAQLAVGKYTLVTGTGPNGLPLRSFVPDAAAAKPMLDQLPSFLD